MTKLLEVVFGNAYEAMRQYVEEIIYTGFPINSILSALHDAIVNNQNVSDLKKALICEKIAKVNTYKWTAMAHVCMYIYLT